MNKNIQKLLLSLIILAFFSTTSLFAKPKFKKYKRVNKIGVSAGVCYSQFGLAKMPYAMMQDITFSYYMNKSSFGLYNEFYGGFAFNSNPVALDSPLNNSGTITELYGLSMYFGIKQHTNEKFVDPFGFSYGADVIVTGFHNSDQNFSSGLLSTGVRFSAGPYLEILPQLFIESQASIVLSYFNDFFEDWDKYTISQYAVALDFPVTVKATYYLF
ncbi:hypothetical protein ACFLZV_02310 [Candidatus Margulisiibacteriota bacterium]